MLLPQTPPFRMRRGVPRPPRRVKPTGPLTLVAADCSEAPVLTLTFDRPIDIAAMAPALLRVDNGLLGFSYVGFLTPTLLDPRTVEIQLTGVEEYLPPDVRLTAAAGNGIVPAAAAGGGPAWAGVTNLALPFG